MAKIFQRGSNTIIKGLFGTTKVINKDGLTGKQQLALARSQQSKAVQMTRAISSSLGQTATAIAGAKAAEKITTNKADAAALASYLNVIRGGEGGTSGSGSTTEVGGSGSKLGG